MLMTSFLGYTIGFLCALNVSQGLVRLLILKMKGNMYDDNFELLNPKIGFITNVLLIIDIVEIARLFIS